MHDRTLKMSPPAVRRRGEYRKVCMCKDLTVFCVQCRADSRPVPCVKYRLSSHTMALMASDS